MGSKYRRTSACVELCGTQDQNGPAQAKELDLEACFLGLSLQGKQFMTLDL